MLHPAPTAVFVCPEFALYSQAILAGRFDGEAATPAGLVVLFVT